MSKPKKNVWTRARLLEMKEKVLPRHATVENALEAAKRKWRWNFSDRQFRHRFRTEFGASPSDFLAKKAYRVKDFGDAPAADSPVYLKKRVETLERELKIANKQTELAAVVKSMLRGAVDVPASPPRWTTRPRGRGRVEHGVPTIFISDVHHGEVVHADQVNGVNSFNAEISRKRLERVFSAVPYFTDDVFSKSDYPGVCVPMGGDLLSGNIHEELRETNSLPIFDALLDLADCLTAGIDLLKDRYRNVFVPCVVGNHGRLDKKPRAKYGPQDNYEYMLYHLLASRYDADDAVTFVVSDSFTLHYRLYGTRYLLTHGDAFRGGSGISGPLLPWTLGDHRLRKQMSAMSAWTKQPTEYDVLVFGHWHRYFAGSSTFICNGSLKGFDEYAKKSGFAFEPAIQAFWFTSPTYGATFHAGVYAEEAPKAEGAAAWASIPRGLEPTGRRR